VLAAGAVQQRQRQRRRDPVLPRGDEVGGLVEATLQDARPPVMVARASSMRAKPSSVRPWDTSA